jgi:hypothetical protein
VNPSFFNPSPRFYAVLPQTQRGRIILYNQILKNNAGKVERLKLPEWVHAGESSTNYINYEVPPCAVHNYTFNAYTPRIEDQSVLLFWFGFYSCLTSDDCNNQKTVTFIRWNDSERTHDCHSLLGTSMVQYICIPTDINASLQHSAREKLLFSPWSNAFLPILGLMVVGVFDRLVPGRGPGRSISSILLRLLAILIVSSLVFASLALMLIAFDLIWTVRILLISTILLVIVAVGPLHLLAVFIRNVSIHFCTFWCLLNNDWRPSNWLKKLTTNWVGFITSIEERKRKVVCDNKTVFEFRREALATFRNNLDKLATLQGITTSNKVRGNDPLGYTSGAGEEMETLSNANNEELIRLVQQLLLDKCALEEYYQSHSDLFTPSYSDMAALQYELNRLDKLVIKKLVPELAQRQFTGEQYRRLTPLLYELCAHHPMFDVLLSQVLINRLYDGFTREKDVENEQVLTEDNTDQEADKEDQTEFKKD